MHIGKRIQKLRKAIKGLSQEKLGVKIGETGNDISLIERGIRTPRWDVVVNIFKAMGYDTFIVKDEESFKM